VPEGPVHIGLIPDGMRRWAVANNATLAESYLRGTAKVTEILLALQRHQVQTVTIYNLSRANLGRTDAELDAVYQASMHFYRTSIPTHFDPAVCSVRFHGDLELLPGTCGAAARDLEDAMIGDQFRINILAAYDSYDELRAASRRAQQEGCDIAEAFEIGRVDMIIRTTPEQLLSGFLPMQSQYATLHFLETPLNDLNVDRIDELVAEFRRLPQLQGR
jgi:undecaprenyl diphosphate synthase